MRRFLPCIALTLLLIASPAVRAGLYYRGEQVAELPSQWSGFLLDQRLLRSIGIRPRPGGPVNPARDRYGREAERLAGLVQHALPGKAPTADDLADLGALYIRLGETARAVESLRAAHRQFPKD